MPANTKNKTETISVISICPGKMHAWVNARITKGKEKGRFIKIRKPL